jgi:hypothetical protein
VRRASAYAAREQVEQIKMTAKPVVSALFKRDRPSWASVQARAKFAHCRLLGKARGFATISVLFFNELIAINESGNTAITAATAKTK